MDEDLRIEKLQGELENARKEIEDLKKQNSLLRQNNTFPEFREKESLKDSVIDAIHHPLLVLDEKLQIVFANEKYHKVFETKPHEIEGIKVFKLEHVGWNIPQLKKILQTILPSKSSMTNFEIEIGESGDEHIVLNAKEIKLDRSEQKYILLSIEDITKRKNAENELRNSEERFHELFYSSTSLLAIFKGPDHVVDIANNSIKAAWGKGDDVIGKPLEEVLPELKEQGIIDLLDRVYKTGEAFHADELPIEIVINGKPETRYFDFTYQAQRDSNGNIIGVSDIANDVTKQALLNEKIKKSELEFRELINFMPHKISLSDAEGNPLFYNKSWLDYLGKDHKDLVNQHWTEIIHPEEKEKFEKEMAVCLSTGEELDSEIRILNKDGEYKWHLLKAIGIKDNNGKVASIITSTTEIQKLKEEESRKEGFLKLVSHELKTPVTSIKGYVQLLLSMINSDMESADSAQPFKPYLNRIETQVERLIRLISEMLDLSRIEQNRLELNSERFNIEEHVENIIEDFTYSNKEVQINLKKDCDCRVVADKDRIGQVLINFITNALKYSPENNRIDISIYKENENVAISVKDYGIGIAQKEINQIFRKFYRVPGNKDETYAGFGVGLYLCNDIIERHNGKIMVNSEPGKGSEFIFTLPLN